MNTRDAEKISLPDRAGRFGRFGGRFVPETLISALDELEREYAAAMDNSQFLERLDALSRNYVGRPTPLYRATNLEKAIKGPRIYLKREDLAHTGAHKINNALGQGLLAARMGKRRVIAETGAGQHGVAAATVCSMLGLQCVVYMGTEDIRRQAPNVQRIRLLGAEIREVSSGSRTLKDAVSEAIRDWAANVETTHYMIGSAVGPHPYPYIVREFQSVIGAEARAQCLEQSGALPHAVIACVGGGSNAIGIFSAFINDDVELIGVEASGKGVETGRHAATVTAGTPGTLHGSLSYVLQDSDGQIAEAHSVSAGLDYPGVGPEHAYLKDAGRAKYFSVTDAEAVSAFELITRAEGIIPALEPAHALAHLAKIGGEMSPKTVVLLLLSGRGDKDLKTVFEFNNNGA